MASLAFHAPFENPDMSIIFKGFNGGTLRDNLWPQFTMELDVQQNFRTVFSIVFPACTGILAGASMSGDLKAPSRSIPKGTIAALAFTYVTYVLLAFLVAGSIERSTLLTDLSILQDVSSPPKLLRSMTALDRSFVGFFLPLSRSYWCRCHLLLFCTWKHDRRR